MSNNAETFKGGDEVYCPSHTVKIVTISEQRGSSTTPLRIKDYYCLTPSGRSTSMDANPSIFHATPENRALLEALYKCEFEPPKLKGSDLTRKLLIEGKHVLCYVNAYSDERAISELKTDIIISFDQCFRTPAGNFWHHAVPCNDYANLPDGILELRE